MADNDRPGPLAKPNAEIGAAIADAAAKQYEESVRREVVDKVAGQMSAIDDLREQRRVIDLQIDHYQRSLDAIRAGEFTVEKQGRSVRLVLNDKTLSLGHWHPEK